MNNEKNFSRYNIVLHINYFQQRLFRKNFPTTNTTINTPWCKTSIIQKDNNVK